MALVGLNLGTLGDLDDGGAAVLINHKIADAVKDLEDRGAKDGKERQVIITIRMRKMDGGKNTAVGVDAVVKAPPFRINDTVTETRIGRGEQPVLVFQQFAPDDPQQRTIDEAGGEIPNE